MADYFDFIKKTVANATANPPAADDKASIPAKPTNNKQIPSFLT